MHILSRTLTVVTLSICGSCRDATSPPPTLLHTDSTAYTATAIGFSEVEVRLVATYANPSDTAVTLDRCTPQTPYPFYAIELVSPASPEGSGYNGAWACVGHDSPIVVAPKAVRTDTFTLHGPSAFDHATNRFIGVIEGRFRISYGGQHSNDFTIKLPPGGVLP